MNAVRKRVALSCWILLAIPSGLACDSNSSGPSATPTNKAAPAQSEEVKSKDSHKGTTKVAKPTSDSL
jgi:hypothetical protein